MKFNTTIFKRKKPRQKMPEPEFENNWQQEQFEEKIKEGVESLQKGKVIIIHDDGRGFELACEIKRQFILEYQKMLAEKIKIKKNGAISVSFDDKTE